MGYQTELELVNAMIQVYYLERNIDKILELVTDQIDWIGTEYSDSASGKSELRTLLEKDIEMYPEPLNIIVEEQSVHKLSDTVSRLSVSGTHKAAITGAITMSIRFTAVCIKQSDGNYLFDCIHASVPSSEIEKYMLEHELNQNRKKIDTLIEGIPGGVAIYRIKKSGTVKAEYVSEGFAKMCGYSLDEFTPVFCDNVLDFVCTDDLPDAIKTVEECLREQNQISAIYHICTKSGKMILNRLNANLIDGEAGEDDRAVLYAVHTIVSKDDEQAIRAQEHYRSILDMTNLAFFEWDKIDGFYTSEKFKDYALYKGGLGAIMGNQKSVDSIHPEDYEKVRTYLTDKRKNCNPSSIVVKMKMKDGSYQYTEITGHVDYSSDGSLRRMTGIMKDVNSEWTKQNQKLQQALENAEKSNQAKTDFLSRVSHDMRTPMNGILGIAKLTKESASIDELKTAIQKIESSGEYLLGIINDTLDFQRIESGRMILEPHPVSTKEVVTNVVEMVTPAAKQKGVNFQMTVKNADMDCYVNIDQMRMKQIFMNLISNAIKFTPEGGTVDVCFECVGHTRNLAHDIITISDTGIGMSEDFIKNKIFKPFSQEYNDVTISNAGSGLGLSIVKKLVELMNGTITVESELGAGTKFIVTIDFERADDYEPTNSINCENDDFYILSGKRILLAEDHPLNAEISKKLLEKMDCSVAWVKNGQECLELFSEAEVNTFDLILMDIRMPLLGGLEATSKIRELKRSDAQSIPIIAMTANAYDDDVKKCLEVGMNAHIAKPIEPKIMYKTMAEYLR